MSKKLSINQGIKDGGCDEVQLAQQSGLPLFDSQETLDQKGKYEQGERAQAQTGAAQINDINNSLNENLPKNQQIGEDGDRDQDQTIKNNLNQNINSINNINIYRGQAPEGIEVPANQAEETRKQQNRLYYPKLFSEGGERGICMLLEQIRSQSIVYQHDEGNLKFRLSSDSAKNL